MITTQGVHAARGDVVEVSGRRVGDPGRKGEILDVLGAEDHRHYLVRWEDGHETVLYPGEGTTVHHRTEPAVRQAPQLDVAAATAQLVDGLREQGVEFELLPHRRTMRATAEARALGVLAQSVAKTLVVRDAEGERVRAVVPATKRLSVERLARAIGSESARLLSESELMSAYPQFELGAVPPFGGPAGERVVIDKELAVVDHVVLEAGVHDTSLRLRTDDLIRIADAQLAEIASD